MQTDEIFVDSTSTVTADAEPAKEAPRRQKWLVKHFGLNRKARRSHERTLRSALAGRNDVNVARFQLKNTPENHPVRKVFIDGRATYVFQPHYQAGIAAYKEAWTKVLGQRDETTEVSAETDAVLKQYAYVQASRAFLDKIVELTRPNVQQKPTLQAA